MSATEGTSKTLRQSPGRRWYRSTRLYGVAAFLILLLVSAYAYQRHNRTIVPPPAVDLQGCDPAVVAAVEQARSRVQQSPRLEEAWGKLGMVLLVHQFLPQAAFCFDKAEQLGPEEPRWPYFQALGAMLKSDLEAAKGKLERAVALCGDEFDGPRLLLAEVLIGLQDYDEAERQFALILEKKPRHLKARLGEARIMIKRGNLRGSLVPLSMVQTSIWTRRTACELLVEVHERMGNPGKAEDARGRLAELPPDLNWPDPLRDELAALYTGKVAWLRQAENLEREGRRAEALDLLQRTVRTYPDAEDAWLALGKALHERKMLGPAEDALRRACALEPTRYEPVNELGRVLITGGNRAEAMKCFRKALELKPNAAEVWHNLGSCLFGSGDRSAALEAYAKSVHYAPETFESQFALGVLLAEKGQSAESLEHAQQAVRLRPHHQQARQLLEQVQKTIASSRPGP